MTSFERISNALTHKPVDRIPKFESFWPETVTQWTEQGHLKPDEDPGAHFDLDIRGGGWLNMTGNLDFAPVVLEETEQTQLRLDGNGATLRWMKHRSQTPEHVDFSVRDRASWDEKIKPSLTFDRRRIPFEGYRKQRTLARQQERFFVWHGVAPFECMHPVCGHEYMLMGMVEDPEWVREMVLSYAKLTIELQETLFEEEGLPDGIWFFEDMGFKGKPFMSPRMYREIVQPGHKLLFEFAHSLGLPVIVHSCGFVEPLVDGLIEAGMDCLQAMEVKAGMDVLRLAERCGDRIAFMGNLDVRSLISNKRERIDAELRAKIEPLVSRGISFIQHTDHSVPPQVEYDNMHFWFERGAEIAHDATRKMA